MMIANIFGVLWAVIAGCLIAIPLKLALALLRYLHAKTEALKQNNVGAAAPERPAEAASPAGTAAEAPPPLVEQLKRRRVAKGLSQEALAAQLGVSRQAVSKWENGDSEPSTANLLALAALYGLSVDELLRGK